jgi:hypothetical protein
MTQNSASPTERGRTASPTDCARRNSARRRDRRRRPELEALEGRQLMSGATAATRLVAANFIGPLQAGWTRAAPPPLNGPPQFLLRYSPEPPALGYTVDLSLIVIGQWGPYYPIGTTWQETVYFGGSTTPVMKTISISTPLFLEMSTGLPGTYLVTATISLGATYPVAAPPPITESVTFSVAAPEDTFKDGVGLDVPLPWQAPAQIEDTVNDGNGLEVGNLFFALIQQNITGFTWFTGETEPPTGWFPSKGGLPSFHWTGDGFGGGGSEGQGYIDQLFNCYLPEAWDLIPIGNICTFTQELRFQWGMPLPGGGTVTFTQDINSLEWSFDKVSPTCYEVS